MINGGNATIFVSDLDRAVQFYSDTLGLKLVYRAGPHWAEIDAGGMHIGLHPHGTDMPKPGTHGSISVGLNVTQSIEGVVETLKKRGVKFAGPIVDDKTVKLAHFGDPDGNELYLCEVKK